MTIQRIYKYLLTIAVAAVLPAATASAQLVFRVCSETCPDPLRDPAGAAACHARIAACESKLTLYNGYMGQLGAGVTTYQLPALYREILQPFYSSNLSNWRFAYSDRQPPNNATTDCNVTYYNDIGFVTLLKAGILTRSWDWLFHELRHFTQCGQLGSRDAYAKMWFGHLEYAFIQNNNLETLHDRMPMEGDAESVATRVMESTRPLRDAKNRLVKPIAVSLAGPGGSVLPDRTTIAMGRYQVTAKIDGGSDPLEKNWSLKSPGATYFAPVPASVLNDGAAFALTPSTAGEYTLRLYVSQPGSNLVTASRQVVISVVSGTKTGSVIQE
jgi:hypothetical protein